VPGIGVREAMRPAISFGQGFGQLRVANPEIHPAKGPGHHDALEKLQQPGRLSWSNVAAKSPN